MEQLGVASRATSIIAAIICGFEYPLRCASKSRASACFWSIFNLPFSWSTGHEMNNPKPQYLLLLLLILAPLTALAEDLLTNVANRKLTSLNGPWHYIVEPYGELAVLRAT